MEEEGKFFSQKTVKYTKLLISMTNFCNFLITYFKCFTCVDLCENIQRVMNYSK